MKSNDHTFKEVPVLEDQALQDMISKSSKALIKTDLPLVYMLKEIKDFKS